MEALSDILRYLRENFLNRRFRWTPLLEIEVNPLDMMHTLSKFHLNFNRQIFINCRSKSFGEFFTFVVREFKMKKESRYRLTILTLRFWEVVDFI